MRRTLRFLLVVAFGVIASGCPRTEAQSQTTVTATVVDGNGIPYGGGTVKATLSPPGANSPCVFTGVDCIPVLNPVGPSPLDFTGSFTLNLYPNSSILCAGQACTTQWTFQVCISPGVVPPFGTGPQCFSVAQTISGSSQNISSALNAVAPLLTHGGGGGGMTWPGAAGIPNYSGSLSWATSYSATNPIPASFITNPLNQNTTGNAATATLATAAVNLQSYPTLCPGSQFSQGLSSGSNNCATPSGGGGTPGGSNLSIQTNNSGAFGGLSSPAGPGFFSVEYDPSTATPVAATADQIGLVPRSLNGTQNTDTVAFSDVFGLIVHDSAATGAINETLPTPTTLSNSGFAYTYCNNSPQTDTITPTTWTISVNGAAAAAAVSVATGTCLHIFVDPFNASVWDGFTSNTGPTMLSNTTPVSTTGVTTIQTMQGLTIPANALNTVGATINFTVAGFGSTGTSPGTLDIELQSDSTVLTVVSGTLPSFNASVTGVPLSIIGSCTTVATGSSGTIFCWISAPHGGLTSNNTMAGATAPIGVNLTVSHVLHWTAKFSAVSSNSVTSEVMAGQIYP